MDDREDVNRALMHVIDDAIAAKYELANVRDIRLRDNSSHARKLAQLLDRRQDAFDEVCRICLGVLGYVVSDRSEIIETGLSP